MSAAAFYTKTVHCSACNPATGEIVGVMLGRTGVAWYAERCTDIASDRFIQRVDELLAAPDPFKIYPNRFERMMNCGVTPLEAL